VQPAATCTVQYCYTYTCETEPVAMLGIQLQNLTVMIAAPASSLLLRYGP
jgi:hypothetical protein